MFVGWTTGREQGWGDEWVVLRLSGWSAVGWMEVWKEGQVDRQVGRWSDGSVDEWMKV